MQTLSGMGWPFLRIVARGTVRDLLSGFLDYGGDSGSLCRYGIAGCEGASSSPSGQWHQSVMTWSGRVLNARVIGSAVSGGFWGVATGRCDCLVCVQPGSNLDVAFGDARLGFPVGQACRMRLLSARGLSGTLWSLLENMGHGDSHVIAA